MEIPYIVEPRKDTGLNNSKIAIWLFLASEVMLFGGLFSGYVFLRVYADYPWPERTLPVLPGLLNTFILIASSITVVFAWVSLKLRQWRKFQVYMSITLICAALFMVFKAVEYKAKLGHQAIRLDDYTVVEGHAYPQEGREKGITKNLNIDAKRMAISVKFVDDAYYKALSEQYEGKFVLADDLKLNSGTEYKKGTAINKELLEEAKVDYLDALAINERINTEINREVIKEANNHPIVGSQRYYEPERKDFLSKRIKELKDEQAELGNYKTITPSLLFDSNEGSSRISVNPRWGKLSNKKEGEEGDLTLKDKTVFIGTTADSSIELHVDGIDFRHTVMKAIEKGIDPEVAINNSWLLKDEGMKLIWDKHQVVVAKLEALLEEHGKGHEPTEVELYRVNWQEIAGLEKTSIADLEGMNHEEIMDLFPGDIEGFAGPDHYKVDYPEIIVPREQVRFEAVFSPRWNTYYATYFTITGLHGLHIIGGALVLGYYLFFGRKMYDSNPEWLANRVEVGGLFWHFVDLVWIFLFPILYLM